MSTPALCLSSKVSSADTFLTPLLLLDETFGGIIASELYTNLESSEIVLENMVEKAPHDVEIAVQRSLNGSKLIHFPDLPKEWRSNPFVYSGYRFIPIDKWPLIILSLFALHNQTRKRRLILVITKDLNNICPVNIHTHLIPGMIWLRNHLPRVSTSPEDLPSLVFTSSALLCLFSSAAWHTMSGCAHLTGMLVCARMDYVGIGWLIAASMGTVVHYGFYCHETPRILFLSLCAVTGLLGTVFPFMDWFDMYEYRVSTNSPRVFL